MSEEGNHRDGPRIPLHPSTVWSEAAAPGLAPAGIQHPGLARNLGDKSGASTAERMVQHTRWGRPRSMALRDLKLKPSLSLSFTPYTFGTG